jgi:hypothetical protein
MVDLPAKEPFDTSRSYLRVNSPYVYIISDKDLHDHFDYKTMMRFYQFNFAEYHILGSLQCKQCFGLLDGSPIAHRNACDKEWVWVKRENKKAFTAIPSYTRPWHARKDLPMYYDTVIKYRDTSSWYTTGHGDCFARFEYAIVADKYHPVLILKEWNHWGGCRAGGSKQATIYFKEPTGVLYKTKRTILAEKQGY